MRDLTKWLDSCFDREDERAPARAFVFGAILASVAAAISSIAVDATNWRMLLILIAGATIVGGGCGAMFAAPPLRFRRMCALGFDLWGLVPLKFFVGLGLLVAIPLAFSFFVGILACIAACDAVVSWVKSVRDHEVVNTER